MRSTIMQRLRPITFMVSEKIPLLKFPTSPGTWLTKKHVKRFPWIHAGSHANYILQPYNTWTTVEKNLNNTLCNGPATLKQGQGHQTWNANVDPEHLNNHAKFERSRLNFLFFFFKWRYMSTVSLKYVQK